MRRERIRPGQRLAAALVAVSLLSACSSDDAEQPSAELPPASSSAAETTPDLPPLGPEDFPVPDEARTQDEAGAEAFLRYYVDLINEQQAKPAGQPLRDLGPECQQCATIAQRFDTAADLGYRINGGEVTIVGKPGIALNGSTANLSFLARATAATVVDADGRAVPDERQAAQKRLPSALTLAWSDERQSWLATGISFG